MPVLYSIMFFETEINETYPYPGKDKVASYVTTELQNIDKQEEELINKVSDLAKTVELGDVSNLFEEYTVKI